MNRIFLIGYMGSGKTTVGKLLAEKLGYSFIDMDSHIEEKQFKSVSQIFSELGEERFRSLEHECLHEVAEFEDVVISTGGGTPCFFDNMEYMNSRGLTVYLQLSAAQLVERLNRSKVNKRPLLENLKDNELLEFIEIGLAKREPFYAKASLIVPSDLETTIEDIYNKLTSYL